MSKKLFLGALLGSAMTGAAWLSLSDKKKEDLKTRLHQRTSAAMDAATDYALDALDIVDAKLAESEVDDKLNRFTDGAKKVKKAATKTAGKVADHLTNDDFDEQTADIRAELAAANHPDDNDDPVVDDDIVIDTTDDDSENKHSDEK